MKLKRKDITKLKVIYKGEEVFGISGYIEEDVKDETLMLFIKPLIEGRKAER